MEQNLKVDRRAFEAVISQLLKTPALPLSQISPKKKAKRKPPLMDACQRSTLWHSGLEHLRGPGVVNLDLGLFRDFRLKERWKIQFRAEAFNATNTPHFRNPGPTGLP